MQTFSVLFADFARAEYTPQPKWPWFRLFVLWAAGCLVMAAPVALWRAWGPAVGGDGEPDPAILSWGRMVVLYYSGLVLGLALFLARSAWLTMRSGQSPHPGAWLPVRRLILRGWLARLSAFSRAAVATALVWTLAAAWMELQLAAMLFGIGTYRSPPAGEGCAAVTASAAAPATPPACRRAPA